MSNNVHSSRRGGDSSNAGDHGDHGRSRRSGDWLRDAEAIYAESFRIIAQEADFSHLAPQTHHIAARIIHACGQPELAPHLRISPGLQQAAEQALRKPCLILTDTEMTRAGIMKRLLPPEAKVHCLLRDTETRQRARESHTTLTAAVVDRWIFQPKRAICIIGNAPTALFRLMERIEDGALQPAAVLAFPVGFVGASESKARFCNLMRSGLEGATLMGRTGGAGMAAAAFNAILLRWRTKAPAN